MSVRGGWFGAAPVSVCLGAASLGQLSAITPGVEPVEDIAPSALAVTFGETCPSSLLIEPGLGSSVFELDLTFFGADGPAGSCNSPGATQMQNDVWLHWEAPMTGEAHITLTDIPPDDFDMIMTVYQGTCEDLIEILCLDDPEPYDITIPVFAHQIYFFQLGAWGTAPSGGHARFVLEPVRPTGEDCANAIEFDPLSYAKQLDTSLFAPSPDVPSCNGGAVETDNDVWFKWTADSQRLMRWQVDDSVGVGYDMVSAIWTGQCGALTELVCMDDPEPYDYTFVAEPGQTYWFQTGDWGTFAGGGLTEFILEEVETGETCLDPYSLEFGQIVGSVGTIDLSTFAADAPPGGCNSTLATVMQNCAWYRVHSDENTVLRFTMDDAVGVGFDMVAAVYEGDRCGALTEIFCLDEPEPFDFEMDVAAGVPYWFQVGDWGSAPGGGAAEIGFFDQAYYTMTGEQCEGAFEITGLPAVFDLDTSTFVANAPPGVCNSSIARDSNMMDNDVWFKWTAPDNGVYQLSVIEPAGGDYDMITMIWTGFCGAPTPVKCLDDPEPHKHTFQTEAGLDYYFQTGDWGSAPGGGPTRVVLQRFTECPWDVTTTNTNPGDMAYGSPDGQLNGADLSYFVERWLLGAADADVTTTNTNPGDFSYGIPDGTINGADLSFYVEGWLAGCP